MVERAAALVGAYRLDDPLDPATTLGPVVRPGAAHLVREQAAEAVAAGARAVVDPGHFARDDGAGAYLAPQILTGVDHRMRVMREETFGPLVGVMSTQSAPFTGSSASIGAMAPYEMSGTTTPDAARPSTKLWSHRLPICSRSRSRKTRSCRPLAPIVRALRSWKSSCASVASDDCR